MAYHFFVKKVGAFLEDFLPKNSGNYAVTMESKQIVVWNVWENSWERGKTQELHFE